MDRGHLYFLKLGCKGAPGMREKTPTHTKEEQNDFGYGGGLGRGPYFL